MEDLIQRLAASTDNERIPLLTEFAHLLHRHIRIEERQLFQEIQAKLDEGELAELGRKVDANVRKVCPVTDRLPWQEANPGEPGG